MLPLSERVRWFGNPNTYNAHHDKNPLARRVRSGLMSVQRTLIANDCACVVNGTYDEYLRRAVAYYQGTNGLREDGIFGQSTARHLFSRVAVRFENDYGLPGPFLRGYAKNEGVWDMCALGPNLVDTGLVQINRGIHPVRLADACDATFSLDWCVKNLMRAMNLFDDWDAAIIYHRSPLWADCMAGVRAWPKPEDEVEARLYVERIKAGG